MNVQERADALATNDLEFHAALVNYRQNSGLTPDEVARRMGVTVQTVRDFEVYWANPTMSLVRRYANAIEVTLDYRIVEPNA